MSLKIKPLEDRVVVEALAADEKTASGIILPDTAQEKPQQGTVVVVGPGKSDKDGKVGMTVNQAMLFYTENIQVQKSHMKVKSYLS
tara:strand:+ start:1109 stop:1366 length:258 start_codon:yes stop_codon:yes gene_type:complete